jgi:putative exosortase-associated protein (TIGR04073 family)
MKNLLLAFSAIAFASTAIADIQDPPMNENGPTRKFSRGVANVLYGISEFPQTIALINDREGNAAALSYGIVRGGFRAAFRIRSGVYEILTFPFPTHRGSFRPPYKSNVPWIHGGFSEWTPELGWETRKKYNTAKHGY